MATTEINDHWLSVMGESVWQRLLAPPYSLEMDDDGCIVMTPLDGVGLTFDQLASTHPILPDALPWKVETNARNQLPMSPPPRLDHAAYETDIIVPLAKLMAGGKALTGAGVKTKMEDGCPMPFGFQPNAGGCSKGKLATRLRLRFASKFFRPATAAGKLRKRSISTSKPGRWRFGPADATGR